MSEVTRFDLVTKGRGFDTWQKMEADPDGEWVKAEDYDALRAEVERLRTDGIHSCHDECPRLACVQRREIERLRAAIMKWREAKCHCACPDCTELIDFADGLPDPTTAERTE